MIFKIIFDTNVLSKGKFSDVQVVYDFLKAHKYVDEVSLCIPEIVINEWKQHQKIKIDGLNKRAKELVKELEEYGHDKVELKDINLNSYINSCVKEFIDKYKIEVIVTPKLDQEELLTRAIQKIPPFNPKTENKKGSDYGFKDTVLFLSLREDSKKSPEQEAIYILMTNDSGFDNTVVKQFDTGSKKLLVMSDTVTLKDELDTRLKLGLNRAQKRANLERQIDNHSEVFDLYLLTRNSRTNGLFVTSRRSEDIEGYSFSSFYINDFEETSPNTFRVEGKIIADVIYKKTKNESNRRQSVYGDEYYYSTPIESMVWDTQNMFGVSNTSWNNNLWQNSSETFLVNLDINTETGSVRIV